MNTEQTEHELTKLDGKSVIVVVPVVGESSISLAGEMKTIQTKEFTCAFHITAQAGSLALLFFAEDVLSMEESVSESFTRVIRLKKN